MTSEKKFSETYLIVSVSLSILLGLILGMALFRWEPSQQEARTCSRLFGEGALVAHCYPKGCSVLVEMKDQTRQWQWLPDTVHIVCTKAEK